MKKSELKQKKLKNKAVQTADSITRGMFKIDALLARAVR